MNYKLNLLLYYYISDEDFLQLINSSSIKDLQSLQTVGAKRAKLIYDWRETYGNFSDVSELISGLASKDKGNSTQFLIIVKHANSKRDTEVCSSGIGVSHSVRVLLLREADSSVGNWARKSQSIIRRLNPLIIHCTIGYLLAMSYNMK